MVDRVVHQVAAEGVDGELGAVAAPAACAAIVPPRPGRTPRPAASAALWSSEATVCRVLPVVVVLGRRGVLVPVGIEGIVLAEHEVKPLVVEAADIAHVAGVLEGDQRSSLGRRRRSSAGPESSRSQAAALDADQPGHLGGRETSRRRTRTRDRVAPGPRSSPCRRARWARQPSSRGRRREEWWPIGLACRIPRLPTEPTATTSHPEGYDKAMGAAYGSAPGIRVVPAVEGPSDRGGTLTIADRRWASGRGHAGGAAAAVPAPAGQADLARRRVRGCSPWWPPWPLWSA